MKHTPWLAIAATLLLAGCGEPASDSAPADGATGFAGLGASAEGFATTAPGTPLRFPADHGPHPDYRIEWWYLTANLEDATGEPLGLQWTLFRQALVPPGERPPADEPWTADQLWMAHLAVSRGEAHRVSERLARSHSQREGKHRAGVEAFPFRAWLDDWTLAASEGADGIDSLTLHAHQDDDRGGFGYRLTLTAEGPLVQHGKPDFTPSSTATETGPTYLSQPFYRVEGEVTLDGETRAVTGRGWLDREWGNQLMAPRHTGWDWFSLHLADGHKLMVYHLRSAKPDGDSLFGTWIAPDGTPSSLSSDALILTPLATYRVAGREVPTRWRIRVPGQDLDLIVEAIHPDRWMPTSVPYWEGAVEAVDADSGEARGVGYLELTGY